MAVNEITPDTPIGQMRQGTLATNISVRAGLIVVKYYNSDKAKGVEVTYSPAAVRQLNDLLSTAARVAEGKA